MNNTKRLNAYRVMWVLVFFDLPTDKAADRETLCPFQKAAAGVVSLCSSLVSICAIAQVGEHAETHINRVKRILPEKGNVGILCITDKQFGMMDLFEGKEETPLPATLSNWKYSERLISRWSKALLCF